MQLFKIVYTTSDGITDSIYVYADSNSAALEKAYEMLGDTDIINFRLRLIERDKRNIPIF